MAKGDMRGDANSRPGIVGHTEAGGGPMWVECRHRMRSGAGCRAADAQGECSRPVAVAHGPIRSHQTPFVVWNVPIRVCRERGQVSF